MNVEKSERGRMAGPHYLDDEEELFMRRRAKRGMPKYLDEDEDEEDETPVVAPEKEEEEKAAPKEKTEQEKLMEQYGNKVLSRAEKREMIKKYRDDRVMRRLQYRKQVREYLREQHEGGEDEDKEEYHGIEEDDDEEEREQARLAGSIGFVIGFLMGSTGAAFKRHRNARVMLSGIGGGVFFGMLMSSSSMQ